MVKFVEVTPFCSDEKEVVFRLKVLFYDLQNETMQLQITWHSYVCYQLSILFGRKVSDTTMQIQDM